MSSIAGCAPDAERSSERSIGVARAALSAPPESNCSSAVSAGRQYWFCKNNAAWSSARQKCQVVGLDLASAQSASENTFIRERVDGDSWLGGSDQTAEGVWTWETGEQFWQGGSSGSAVAGAYANWDSFQPGSSTQDCLELDRLSSKWSDESCGNSRDYVCEGSEDLCPADPDKDAPGQCGCGNPDTDGDGDGTADCNDGCDADPNKTAAGQCGCGAADTDTDSDGTADCADGCDEDPANTVPDCTPDTNCTRLLLGSSAYWFCNAYRTWTDARDRCAGAGYRLARIDSAPENTFIEQQILTDRWIGGSDVAQEGAWVWEIGGDPFWQGGSGGSSQSGLYSRWNVGQPNDLGIGGEDCLQIEGDGRAIASNLL